MHLALIDRALWMNRNPTKRNPRNKKRRERERERERGNQKITPRMYLICIGMPIIIKDKKKPIQIPKTNPKPQTVDHD